MYLLSKFSSFKTSFFEGDSESINSHELVQKLTNRPTYSDEQITWCQELTYWQPAGAGIVYGNDASGRTFYQAASIFVGIPKWGRKRKGYASIRPEGEGQKNSSEDDGSEDIDIEKFCFSPSAKVP